MQINELAECYLELSHGVHNKSTGALIYMSVRHEVVAEVTTSQFSLDRT